jgi:hypothetical protein
LKDVILDHEDADGRKVCLRHVSVPVW